jgi:hypothetical protein
MLSNLVLLSISLLQKTMLNHKLHILLGNRNINISVIHLLKHLGSKLELGSIVNHLLHTKYHPELAMVRILSQCLKHSKVTIKLTRLTSPLEV